MPTAKKPPARKAAKKPTPKGAPAKKPAVRKPRAAKAETVAVAVERLFRDTARSDAEGKALGAIALNLARLLDAGAGMSSAAVARELRETMDRMCDLHAGDEDAFEAWEAQLAQAD